MNVSLTSPETPSCDLLMPCLPVPGCQEPSPLRHLENFVWNFSFPKAVHLSIEEATGANCRRFGSADSQPDSTAEPVLDHIITFFDVAPSTYWKEYNKTYWHMRTLHLIYELSKVAASYEFVNRETPWDLSLQKKEVELPSSSSSPAGQNPLQDLTNLALPQATVVEDHRATGRGTATPRRAPRTSFSKTQLSALMRAYKINNFVSSKQRPLLARQLGVSEEVVSVWFKNQRMRTKRMKK